MFVCVRWLYRPGLAQSEDGSGLQSRNHGHQRMQVIQLQKFLKKETKQKCAQWLTAIKKQNLKMGVSSQKETAGVFIMFAIKRM